jgi:hypothetical protein
MVETRYRGRQRYDTEVLRFTRAARVAVWDTLIVTATGDAYRLDLRNASGRIISRITVPVRRRAVTQAMKNRLVQTDLERLRGPRSEGLVDAAESERLIRERPSLDSLPAHGALFVAPNRTLWVMDSEAPGDTAWSATAFTLDGGISGRLVGPAGSRPLAFGSDRVVLRTTDADGVVSLEVRRFGPIATDRRRP